MQASRQATLSHARENQLFRTTVVNVSKTFKQVNIHKALGPDGLPGCVFRACADQLASVFTDIFNLSVTESVIPTRFKQTIIIPVPMNAKVTCLNDYCPVGLCSHEVLSHTAPICITDPQMMQSLLHSTQLIPTWSTMHLCKNAIH